MKHDQSEKIWQRSLQRIPGGVNSPVRAFRSVGMNPVILESGKGAYVTDVDGNSYLDFVSSWGPLILGHSPAVVRDAVRKQLKKGTSFGAATRLEEEMADFICSRIPRAEQIRFVSSGTEAVMSALRLARAATGRELIVKFSGCYHGHADSMLVKAGSGLLTLTGNISEASSPGIPAAVAAGTLSLPLDDGEALKQTFEKYGDKIAAIIIEPLPANSGLLKQRNEFLLLLREITRKHGSLLIYDEVISGFRLGFGGFTGKYGHEPDLLTYGKIIGGGLPVGAFAGSRQLMSHLAPAGGVYQAGTLSGNPLAMSAGLAVLRELADGSVYEKLRTLMGELQRNFEKQVSPLFTSRSPFRLHLVSEESIFWLQFSAPDENTPVRRVENIKSGSADWYAGIFRYLLERNIYLAPSAYEVGFLSAAFRKSDLDLFTSTLALAVESVSGGAAAAE